MIKVLYNDQTSLKTDLEDSRLEIFLQCSSVEHHLDVRTKHCMLLVRFKIATQRDGNIIL